MANTELDLAIERMNKSVDAAIVGILNGIVAMVDLHCVELINSLSPEVVAAKELEYQEEMEAAHRAWQRKRDGFMV